MAISIVMPCYNEEKVIEEVVRNYYNNIILRIEGSEFIIVDDSSTDKSYEILLRLQKELPHITALRTTRNNGHGKALRIGYEKARKEYVFQVDSDNQFKADDFWKLYNLRNDYKIILGYREVRHDHWSRISLTRIMRLVNFILFGVWLRDANCPFRLMDRMLLSDFLGFIGPEFLAPNIAVSILARTKNIKTAEVPVTHMERKTGKTSMAGIKLIKFSLKGLGQLMALRMRLLC